jgi:RNA polymerase sigma-70 factor (ECF subfamily)
MKKTQEGDSGAYERLLTEISPLVFNFVRKKVYDRQQVEDVYQEVLLTFHKAKHNYRAGRPFGPWFFAVIRNSIWSALKKNHRILQREVLMEDFFQFASPEKEVERDDHRLHLALESLPEKYRQAVELLKLKEMSVETAAQQLGISKVAVRVRAHRGYALLRKYLKTRKGKSE